MPKYISIRKQLEDDEKRYLSKYAKLSSESEGRLREEAECDIRPIFQRDRDKILHSKSFRRLKHKTQVFLSPEGDHYRTRLTHALEVSQIARTIAKSLRLNESLVEAISLAHDIGHTPFGHAGEETLNAVHKGGFSHVEQSLRVVDVLENDGKGLNLSAEVRDGIVNHSKGEKGKIIDNLIGKTMESRIVRISDIIAYINHDIDDAIRANIISVKDLGKKLKVLGKTHGQRINTMVFDIIIETIKRNNGNLYMSDKILDSMLILRAYLFQNVYMEKTLLEAKQKASNVVLKIYLYYLDHEQKFENDSYEFRFGKDKLDVRVKDFIAGMTDRYALMKYEELFMPRPWKVC